MKVYMLLADSDHYESLLMPGGDLYEFARRFNGKPMKRLGGDPKIKKYRGRLPKGDFPSLIPGVPVFSPRAVEALRDLLEETGEIFPVTISSEEYFVFNVTKIVDALDEPNSEVIRFKGSSKVLNIRSHSFYTEKLFGIVIFKIPQVITMDVFVTDTFVERVHSAGLEGFWFPAVWSSDEVIESQDIGSLFS